MTWIALLALAGLVAAALAAPLLRSRGDAKRRASHDRAVLEDQLAEVSRDLDRGVLNPEEADAVRAEASRRLLTVLDEEVEEEPAGTAPRHVTQLAAVVVAASILVGGLGIYAFQGNPGLPDMPREARLAAAEAQWQQRPSQTEAEAVFADQAEAARAATPERDAAMIAELAQILADRSDDVEGHRVMARNLALHGRWAEAGAAQATVLRLLGAQATANDHAELADYLVRATGGFVSPEAEVAINRTLELAPRHPIGRYLKGLSYLRAGRPDLGVPMWQTLVAEGPADAPWVMAIQSALGAPQGPDRATVDAAEDLTVEERRQMIEGMVGSLASRLANEGGPPEDWAQLIRSLGVLERLGEASRIWEEAQEVFADEPAALAMLRAAARDAEIAAQ